MTITPNSTCSQIVITSDILLVLNTANTLTVTYNGTAHTVTVPTGISSFTLLPEHVDMEDTFTDGVYTIKFINTLASSSIQSDLGCAVILCGKECAATTLSWYATPVLEKVLAYEALKASNSCATCDCATLQSMFNSIDTDDTTTCASCSCTM